MAQNNSFAAALSNYDLVEKLASGSPLDDAEIERLSGLSYGEDFEKNVVKKLRLKVDKKIEAMKLKETNMGKMTSVHLAAIVGTPDLMDRLLSRRSELLSDIENAKKEGQTPPQLEPLTKKLENATNAEGRTHLHLAALTGNLQMVRFLIEKNDEDPLSLDINATDAEGQTPLHLAALTGKLEIVHFLVTNAKIKNKLRGDAEDNLTQTAYEIAVELEWHEIVRELLVHQDVQRYLEEKRSDRNIYGGGINAILVGAALIASITFAGWLQPPLGYQAYYQYPRHTTMADAPPDDFQQYATVGEHLTVKVFWIANSLSFYCAIACILSGAAALVPRDSLKELAEVRRLRGAVYLTGFTLSWAVLFVVIAFTAAGFASLPPIIKYDVYMIVTLVLGVLVCLQGFVGARISDPIALQRLTGFIDPTFYLSNLSKYLEKFCERLPGVTYKSYESRRKERRKLYNPVPSKEEAQAKMQDPAKEGSQQASNGRSGHHVV